MQEDNEQTSEELILCPSGCGRKFNHDSLIKHMKICKEVFQDKRLAFNSQLKRVGYDYFCSNQDKLIKLKSPKSTKSKTEKSEKIENVNIQQQTPYKKPVVQSRYNQIFIPKKVCLGCMREFDARIAEQHIVNCMNKKKYENLFHKNY